MERSRGNSSRLRLLLAVLLFELVSAAAAITRDDFPEGFVFGAGSSAYQEDVRLMHEMGLDAYRFSISWPRLIPDGLGAVNQKGLEYYNSLIDELLKHVPFKSSRHQEFKQPGLGLQNDDAPWALRKLLEHLQIKYANPPVIIYENGAGHEPDPSGGLLYDDEFRSPFLQVYIEAALQSIRNGSNVRGYFVWSFMDVFEYIYAYEFQFGLIGVDYGAEGRTRYPRSSARWYAGFLHGGELRTVAPDGSRASS
ncbi:hypothetical protein ACQ4PT_057926 [Festuca glaucescens]